MWVWASVRDRYYQAICQNFQAWKHAGFWRVTSDEWLQLRQTWRCSLSVWNWIERALGMEIVLTHGKYSVHMSICVWDLFNLKAKLLCDSFNKGMIEWGLPAPCSIWYSLKHACGMLEVLTASLPSHRFTNQSVSTVVCLGGWWSQIFVSGY